MPQLTFSFFDYLREQRLADEIDSARAGIIRMNEENDNERALNRIENFDFNSIPPFFCCPLSMRIMVDPVIDPSTLIPDVNPNALARNYGDVARYERKWLERAIAINGISPTTRKAITATQLIPDTQLKSDIDSFITAQLGEYENRLQHRQA